MNRRVYSIMMLTHKDGSIQALFSRDSRFLIKGKMRTPSQATLNRINNLVDFGVVVPTTIRWSLKPFEVLNQIILRRKA